MKLLSIRSLLFTMAFFGSSAAFAQYECWRFDAQPRMCEMRGCKYDYYRNRCDVRHQPPYHRCERYTDPYSCRRVGCFWSNRARTCLSGVLSPYLPYPDPETPFPPYSPYLPDPDSPFSPDNPNPDIFPPPVDTSPVGPT